MRLSPAYDACRTGNPAKDATIKLRHYLNLVGLEMHGITGLVLDPYLDAMRFGEVIENFRGLALGKLCAVEIDADRNATIGGTRERLHDRPVRQDIRRHVDFTLGAIDHGNVDVFKVFRWRVMNDRRGIGAAWRERGEKKNCGYGFVQQVQTDHEAAWNGVALPQVLPQRETWLDYNRRKLV
jgi:hypothetical protein